MDSKVQNWLLIGCGCGCFLIVLSIVGVVAGSAMLARNTTEGFDAAVESRKALEEQFGDPKEFVPWADGAIPADRLEAFLKARDLMQPARKKLLESISGLPTTEEEQEELDSKRGMDKAAAIFDVVRAGMGLGASMGDFFEARNAGLLEAGMGLGEYTYIYVMVYFNALEYSMNDTGEGLDMPNQPKVRVIQTLEAQLRNQLEALDDTPETTAWREQLTAELARLDEKAGRLAWEDGLPEPLAASIEPFAERLEASYVAETNTFELARSRKQGNMSFQAD